MCPRSVQGQGSGSSSEDGLQVGCEGVDSSRGALISGEGVSGSGRPSTLGPWDGIAPSGGTASPDWPRLQARYDHYHGWYLHVMARADAIVTAQETDDLARYVAQDHADGVRHAFDRCVQDAAPTFCGPCGAQVVQGDDERRTDPWPS